MGAKRMPRGEELITKFNNRGVIMWTRFSFLLVISLGTTLPAQTPAQSFDTWAEEFAEDVVRLNPFWVTMKQYFTGEEQDRYDRSVKLTMGVNAAKEKADLARRGLKELNKFQMSDLTPEQRISAAVIRWTCEDMIAEEPFAAHEYIFNHFYGLHNYTVMFITVNHPIRNVRDVENYVARMGQVASVFDEGLAEAELAAKRGILPPRFVIERTLTYIENFLAQKPEETAFVTSLKERMPQAGEEIPAAKQAQLLAAAEREVTETIRPAFERLQNVLTKQLPNAGSEAGIWHHPKGDEAYAQRLRRSTTTSLSPDEIHEIGLRRVSEIESEMDKILRELKLVEGTVDERLESLNATLKLPTDDDPREALLEEVTNVIRDAEQRCETMFDMRPKAPIIVKREPALTEKTTAAHYQRPAPDGSLPGIYWIPLGDIGPKVIWVGAGLKSVAYHEAIPGHHFQVALQQEMTSLPKFRRLLVMGGNSAYIEGWALYAEQLADEDGWYKDDPIGRLGFLDSQLLRARRLVVDTGLHAKKWTREQVIDYGIPVSEAERYVVLPGQACSYMIGQLKILELRSKAQQELGPKFDIKEFHNTVLSEGSIPLEVLEEVVDAWIASQANESPPTNGSKR